MAGGLGKARAPVSIGDLAGLGAGTKFRMPAYWLINQSNSNGIWSNMGGRRSQTDRVSFCSGAPREVQQREVLGDGRCEPSVDTI